MTPDLQALIELLPCPFCGNKSPFTYINVFTAVLRCRCGAEAGGNISATVMYKREELPEELKAAAYEPTALSIKNADGSLTPYPDHGYVGVSVLAALAYVGAVDRWNTRQPAPTLPGAGGAGEPQHCPYCKFTMSGLGWCVNCTGKAAQPQPANTAAPGLPELLARITSNAIAADANRMAALANCLRDARDALAAQPAHGVQSPSYDALLIIMQSVSAAFERAGIADCDDPGEVIDILAADTKRIDWLESNMAHYGDGYTEPREAAISWPGWQQHAPKEPNFPGLRIALDAAMEIENESD